MAEFSFENDIAPMRGSYFSDSSLNDRERRQLQSDYMQRVAPYESANIKSMERMLTLQGQELSFQRQKMELEKSKEESRFLLDTNSKLGGLTASLGTILNDGSKDSFGKAEDITNLQMANAVEIARNPTYRAIFDAASTRLGVDDKRKTLEDKKEADRLRAIDVAVQLGDSKLVKQMAGDMDPVLLQGRMDLAAGVKADKDQQLKAVSDTQAYKYDREDARDQRRIDLQILNGYESSLRSMKPPSMTDDEMLTSLKKGELPSAEKIGTKEFSEMDSIELKEILMDLNPSLEKDPKRLDSVPTMELYRMAFRGLNRKRNRYLPEDANPAGGVRQKFNE